MFEWLTATCAWCDGGGGGTPWFQPKILPSSVAKMNTEGPDAAPFETTNCVPAFETAPVGAFGTWTTSETAVPSARYSVVALAPLSDTHQGEGASVVSPQPLTRFASR